MITSPPAPETLVRKVRASTLLGVSTSLKSERSGHRRSAARAMLQYALDTVADVYSDVCLLDLRDVPIPFFDGRLPQDHEDPAVRIAWSCVRNAGALLLSVPAYWCGVSGVFKNFIDTLCGPVYDMGENCTTAFHEKPVGLLIVGADASSARYGEIQARQIVQSVGAVLVDPPVVVDNPRTGALDAEQVSSQLIALTGELARRAHLFSRMGAEKSGA